MNFLINVERNSPRPIYQQIMSQIKRQISVGELPAGTRLPPVRQLAESIGVTRLTVHNAYSELQASGWVEARVGSGTFVTAGLEQEALLAAHLERHKQALHYCSDMHRLIQLGTLHSMAYAVPDINLVPGEEFIGILNQCKNDADKLLHYGGQDGDMDLRLALTSLLAERGLLALPDNILITNGATQALALVSQLLATRGDVILTEHPTYLGQMKVFDALGLRAVGVPMDDDGPIILAMEALIKEHQPRFLSLVPNFHNPTGIVMGIDRRRELIKLAMRYKLPIIEDDVYAMLSYDGPPPPALKSLDVDDSVFYISSVSKTVAPGLRIGWLVAPPHYHAKIVQLKWAMELSGSPLIHRALAIYLREGRLKTHLRRILPIYRERRDAFMDALARHMPAETEWHVPEGGLCTWVRLPRGGNYCDLYPAALKRGVAYTPDEAFFSVPANDAYHMRLCFGTNDTASNENAIRILGELIHERLKERQPERTLQ